MPFNQILELAVVILANTACKMLKKKKKKGQNPVCFFLLLSDHTSFTWSVLEQNGIYCWKGHKCTSQLW